MVVKQLLAVAIGIAAVLFLMSLPKVIINKDDKNKLADNRNSMPDVAAFRQKTKPVVSGKDKLIIERLRNFYNNTSSLEKKCTFADSLTKVFISIQEIDSAIAYAERIVLINPGIKSSKIAADTYFSAFNIVTEPTLSASFSDKARQAYLSVLQYEPDNLEAKNNLAMTYVTSENPMQAIALLREVIQKDPKNSTANFNLGYLSVLSGQYDKAINRFEALLKDNPRFWKARLYLGIALKETGKKEQANEEFAQVIKNERDPALVAEAQNQLKN
ncbi:MAG: tetratricopeptide repeat protein [Bacteroidota bacterium]|nr:tetratricopeptide repeat protein [Bacteroidota bacterium]